MMQNSIKKLPKLHLPVIVEGKYDKAAVCSMFSATVIATDGFGVFNSKEKQALIRAVCKNRVILLTDSDGAGKVIRGFLSGIIPKDKIYQVYVPRVEGKEKRKTRRSKEGLLGVEGVGADILRPLLEPFCIGEELPVKNEISTAELFELGLTGKDDSAYLRDKVCLRLGLPTGMGAKAFSAAAALVSDRDKLAEILSDEKKSDI
jgi:ribonuclease M5